MARGFCAKIGVAILDIIVALLGLVLLVAGLWLRFSSGMLSSIVVDLFDNIEYNNLRVGHMVLTIALLVACLGGAMILVAVLGMCGSWKMVKGCLVLYMIFVVLLLLVQAVAVGLIVSYHAKTDTWLRGQMLDLLRTYSGPTATDRISEGWNTLFMDGHCCAVTDQYANGGNNNDFLDRTTTWYANRAGDNLPASCCQGATASTVSSYIGTNYCTTPPANFYTKGCWTKVRELAVIYLALIAASCFLAIVVEIASLVLSCVVMDNATHRIRTTGPVRGQQKIPPPYVGIDSVVKNRR